MKKVKKFSKSQKFSKIKKIQQILKKLDYLIEENFGSISSQMRMNNEFRSLSISRNDFSSLKILKTKYQSERANGNFLKKKSTLNFKKKISKNLKEGDLISVQVFDAEEYSNKVGKGKLVIKDEEFFDLSSGVQRV